MGDYNVFLIDNESIEDGDKRRKALKDHTTAIRKQAGEWKRGRRAERETLKASIARMSIEAVGSSNEVADP